MAALCKQTVGFRNAIIGGMASGMESAMRQKIKNFIAAEDGAVTVDWVVLTAAVVGLGFAVIYSMADGSATLADNLGNGIAGISVDAGD